MPIKCGTVHFGMCRNVPATEVSYQALVWVYRLTTERRGPPCNPKDESQPDPNPQPVPEGWTRLCSDPLLPEQPWFWVIPQPSDPMSTGVGKRITP